jgi:Vacuolar protein sorting-associated protein 62
MRVGVRASLAATLAVGLTIAAGVASAAAGPSEAALLARYAPLLLLHPQERFEPSPVAPFLAGSDLLARAPDGTWAPQQGPLPTGGAPGSFRLDVRGCSPAAVLDAVDCYAALAGPPTAYAAVHRRAGRTVLQYWFFYPYNLWSPIVPPSAQFWQSHEGDWEEVSVLLDPRFRPVTIAASRHCGGVRRDWSRVVRRGTRPLVYVSLGSHANGFRPGTATVDPKCWPKEGVAVYSAYGVAMLDHAAAGRTVDPRLVRVTALSPSWLRFPGTWGEDQYVGFPNVVLRFGAGPIGPAFQDDWRDPLRMLTWPRG